MPGVDITVTEELGNCSCFQGDQLSCLPSLLVGKTIRVLHSTFTSLGLDQYNKFLFLTHRRPCLPVLYVPTSRQILVRLGINMDVVVEALPFCLDMLQQYKAHIAIHPVHLLSFFPITHFYICLLDWSNSITRIGSHSRMLQTVFDRHWVIWLSDRPCLRHCSISISSSPRLPYIVPVID